MKRHLQNKIAESDRTFPICAITGFVLWCISSPLATSWPCMLLTVAIAYVLAQMNVIFALLRIRSRMIACCFILLSSCCVSLHSETKGFCIALCVALAIFCLNRTYENSRAVVDSLHIYFLLAIAAIIYPPILALVLVFIYCQAKYMRSLSLRTFSAAMMGIGVVGLGAFGYWLLVRGNWENIAYPEFLVYSEFLENPIENLLKPEPLLLLLFSITGLLHYLQDKYNDKIQVRMCYYTLITLQVVVTVAVVVVPQQTMLYPLLLLLITPAAAHSFSLGHSWLSNAWFILCTMMVLAVFILEQI